MKSWEVLAVCVSCGKNKIKRRDEYKPDTYMCIECFRKHRGSQLGSQFGKQQEYQGRCAGCGVAIPTSRRWCDSAECQSKKQQYLSARMIGSNNPMWTGNHVCDCGANKSPRAKQCRSCSFKDGKRSGTNNGRYVSNNRQVFLDNQISGKVLRSMLDNFLRSAGTKKNTRSEQLLKYSVDDFKKHIEAQFEPWMTWENHGNGANCWNVDHIVPVSCFIKLGITDPSIVNALINLRPLRQSDNLNKSNSLPDNYSEIMMELGLL